MCENPKVKDAKDTTIECLYCDGTFKYIEISGNPKLYCEVADYFVHGDSAFGEWLLTQGEVVDKDENNS